MDVLLAQLLFFAMLALPLATVVTPPVMMAVHRRVHPAAALLYLTALVALVAWVVASNAHMEWADRTGGEGSIFAGGEWLLAGVLAASASVWWTVRGQRSKAVG
jgi:hypothetical protein